MFLPSRPQLIISREHCVEVIYLDESPPPLYLLTVYGGTLRFADWVGDIALNCSYIFIFGGKFIVGTEENPVQLGSNGDRNDEYLCANRENSTHQQNMDRDLT